MVDLKTDHNQHEGIFEMNGGNIFKIILPFLKFNSNLKT